MFIEALLPAARERLVTVPDNAALMEAARHLSQTQIGLVIVCDTRNALAGVIAKSDVVRQIGHCAGSSCMAAVSSVMTRDVTSCRPGDLLADVWATMKAGNLKHVPIIDDSLHPLGVLYAGDALQALLSEVENEQLLLRDYVTGIGYR